MFDTGATVQEEIIPFQGTGVPIGLHPHLYTYRSTILVMKEAVLSLTGDSFHVTDHETGEKVLSCEGHISFGQKKTWADVHGRHLFTIRQEHMHLHKTFIAERNENEPIFKIVSSLHLLSGASQVLEFTNAANEQKAELHLKGHSWTNTRAEITFEDQIVATIEMKHVWESLRAMADKQTYTVTISPGVDIALIAALVVCFDELAHDFHKPKH